MKRITPSLHLILTIILAGVIATCLAACGGGGGGTSSGNNNDGTSTEKTTSTYSIGGTLSGLANGAQVVIQNNGSDALTLSANGSFTFDTQVGYSGQYAITISSQPGGQICSVANGTGSGSGVIANISNISITCSSDIYSISGNLTGLAVGGQITLQNNGANPLTLTGNGAFVFSTPIAYNGSYTVTIGSQPAGEVCSVANGTGSGAGVTANIGNVSITCSPDGYSIGGNVSGLADGSQVTIENNGANPLTLTNGPFAFTTLVAYNGSYSVTINNQPPGQICAIAGGSGSGSGVIADVRNVSIICSADTYTIGGTITGLASSAQVTLQNNGANPLTINANGTFTFKTPVSYNSSYAVTVSGQPVGQVCSVTNGTGAGAGVTTSVSNINITCSTDSYSIGGSLSGLANGAQVTLQNNAANPLTLTANGAFVFSTPIAYNGSYAVTVSTQPSGQICSVTSGSGSGTGITANVTNVGITCSTSGYTVGGTITGLSKNQVLTLLDNAANPTTIIGSGSGNDAFLFSTRVANQGSYAVTVGTQPTNQFCRVSGGSGAGSGITANVTTVAISCGGVAYIDPSASSNGNGTQASPYNTWNGVELKAGYSYLQKAGTTYSGLGVSGVAGEVDIGSVAGTAAAPVFIDQYGSGAQPTIRNLVVGHATYVTFQNYNVTGGMVIAADGVNQAITINQNTISNPNANGVGIYAGNGYATITNNLIQNTQNFGIDIAGQYNTVSGNTVTNAGSHGIEVQGAYNTITHNVFSGSGTSVPGSSGIHLYAGNISNGFNTYTHDNTVQYNVVYNTMDGSKGDGNGIQLDQHTFNNTVTQNLSFSNDGQGISIFDSWGNTVTGNTFFGNGRNTDGIHSLVGNIVVDGVAPLGVVCTYGNTIQNNTVIVSASGTVAPQQSALFFNSLGTVVGPATSGPFGFAVTGLTGSNTYGGNQLLIATANSGNVYYWQKYTLPSTIPTDSNDSSTWNALPTHATPDVFGTVPMSNIANTTQSMDFIIPSQYVFSFALNNNTVTLYGWRADTGLFGSYQ